MILLHAYRRILEVLIIGGDHHGEKAFIPRIVLKPSSSQYPFSLKRRQFPVRLSFAMTINKAEGQSLKYVGVHLISPVFCHGQLYVALSRATSCRRVLILLPDPPSTKTPNVVYLGIITGFRTRHGLRVGYKGVRVRVAKSVPWQNPYPQRGLRVTRGVTRIYIIIVFTNNITNTNICHGLLLFICHMAPHKRQR
jgi:hypothetical protein